MAYGSLLWIRERARVLAWDGERVRLRYEADGAERARTPWPSRLAAPVVGRCIPNGVHREGARIFVEVTDVRVERVQEITEEDILAEGVPEHMGGCGHMIGCGTCGGCEDLRGRFARLWNAAYGAGAWERNDWVWRIAFRRVDAPAQKGRAA